jgi:prolyl-tRNA synthetase
LKVTRLLNPTLREAPAEAEIMSHQLMYRAGLIRKVAAGMYTYLPLGWRVIKKIEQIIREEMDGAGGQEVMMPIIQPAEIWQETGRWDVYGQEMFRLQDRHGRFFCLGPTHEEIITDLVRSEVRSYKELPLLLYQIQNKYRDEIRPRFGLMRGREFIMKDLYSFDMDPEGGSVSYQLMYKAYENIFKRCGLTFRSVEADAGAIGGTGGTHEFMVLAESGEAEVVFCSACAYAANVEQAQAGHGDPCPKCGKPLDSARGIEVGQVFNLGYKYSEQLGATYIDDQGKEKPCYMGCYGIGVSRTMAASIEQNNDENGIIWSMAIAPFQCIVVPVNSKDELLYETSESLYIKLAEAGVEVIFDDRDERPGVKFKDADLVGYPLRITIGAKALAEGQVELLERKSGLMERIPVADVVQVVRDRILKQLSAE